MQHHAEQTPTPAFVENYLFWFVPGTYARSFPLSFGSISTYNEYTRTHTPNECGF